MNKMLRTLGRIAVPAAVVTSALLIPSTSFAQVMPNSTLSISVGADRLLRPNSITNIVSNTVLQVDGTLRVAANSQATLKLNAGSLIQGIGSVKVEPGSTLIIDSTQGQLGKLIVDNQGTVVFKGIVDCGRGLDFRSSGVLRLDTPTVTASTDFNTLKTNLKALYPDTGALFTIQNGGTLTGNGVLNGNVVVNSGGKIVLSSGKSVGSASASNFAVTRDSSGNTVVRKPATPSPSPDFITITGDVTTTSGSIDVDMSSTYYGQMSILGTVVVGGTVLNCNLIGGYVPAYVDAFRIIRATNINGQFGTFNATALNFDNRGTIVLTDGTKAYRLSGY